MFDYLISLEQVVDTDYKNFLILYSCLDVPGVGMKNEKVYIHSRDPNITDKLEIGQLITFDSKNIKEVSERSYTIEETNIAILMAKTNTNPITKYFQLLNPRFC